MYLVALGISESILFPWTQDEETEETAAENGGGGGVIVIAAQRHNIQARLLPLSSMMETSIETRGGLEFINIVELKFAIPLCVLYPLMLKYLVSLCLLR